MTNETSDLQENGNSGVVIKHDNVVLTCIDGSSVSEAVCDYASWIANTASAPLKLLHTIPHPSTAQVSDYSGAIGLGSREDLLNELTEVEQSRSKLLIEKGQLLLKGCKERVKNADVKDVEICQRHGTLTEALIDLEEKTRVIVVGIRGEDHDEAQDQGVGTKLESIARSVHKPILVVNRAFKKPQTIMLAYDGSPCCKKAIDMIANSQLFKGTNCHIVHVGEHAESLLRTASELLKGAELTISTKQLTGKTDEALAEYQAENDIDLMLMGAFSHSRFREFLWGSFTAKMLAKTRKPLLLLR